MTAKPGRRLLAGLVLLVCSAVLFLFVTGFPHATALGAYRALERQNLFGPGEIVAVIPVKDYFQTTLYLTRAGDDWAVGAVRPLIPSAFSRHGAGFYTTSNIPARPLVLVEDGTSSASDYNGLRFVLVNDPAIVRVEGVCSTEDGPVPLSQHSSGDGWAVLEAPYPTDVRSAVIRLRAYDAQSNLIYESAP